MRLLLDTHILLWSLLEPKYLNPQVAAALEDKNNVLWLSPIVIWEVLILAERGRVVLRPNAVIWVQQVLQKIPFQEAPLTHDVAIQSRLIDLPHQDPVDRFLAATAVVYGLLLVTADKDLLNSPSVPTLSVKE